MAQLFEALRYKPEGRGFDSRYHNPSGRTISLGLTQPLTNEYQEYFLGGKGCRCVGLTTLPPSCADKSGILNLLEPSGPVQACNGIALHLPLPCVKYIVIHMCPALNGT
jgi:hypothetical protein